MYTPPNEYEPRIPGNLIRAVVSKLPKVEGMVLMSDLKYITPMVVGFVPSNVNLEKVVVPPEIQIDDVIEIIWLVEKIFKMSQNVIWLVEKIFKTSKK